MDPSEVAEGQDSQASKNVICITAITLVTHANVAHAQRFASPW
jgi:hypothetical protein